MKDKTSLLQQVTRHLAVKFFVMMVIITPSWAMDDSGKLRERVRQHLLVFGPTATISDMAIYQDSIVTTDFSLPAESEQNLAEEALNRALKKYEVSLP